MTDRVESATQCLASARRGVAWLLENQNTDGSWKRLPDPPFDAFYRAGWTLELMGEPGAAGRAISLVKARFMTPEGDFLPRENGWYKQVHYPYVNAALALGAHLLGRYDVSVPALRFLLAQQDPTHGGFQMFPSTASGRSPANTISTAMAGIACLAAGQMEAAVRAGDWLCRLVEMQPSPAERFYTTTDPDGRIRTDFAADESRWHLLDVTAENQSWYSIGLPFAFAILLQEATGEQRHADLVRWFLDLHQCCVNPWDGPSSGKGAWACGMLYRLTGEPRYRDIALHVAGNFTQRQMPEGWFRGWLYVPPKPGAEHLLTVRQFESTLEFSLWLGLIAQNLLARDPE